MAAGSGSQQVDASNALVRRLLDMAWWLGARWIVIAMVLLGWELASHSGAVTPFMLPSIESVLGRIVQDARSSDLFINLGLTLYRAMAGFLIAAVVGVILGMSISGNALV